MGFDLLYDESVTELLRWRFLLKTHDRGLRTGFEADRVGNKPIPPHKMRNGFSSQTQNFLGGSHLHKEDIISEKIRKTG